MNASDAPFTNDDKAMEQLLVAKLDLAGREDSQVGRIALDVGAAIVDGTLRPNADLNSVDLAKQYGTSRTPVREALLILEKNGLVDIPPRRRPTVVNLLASPIGDIYEVRALMTGYTVTLVCDKWQGNDLDRMAELVASMEKACADNDLTSFFWANIYFGEEATRIANNEVVVKIFDSLGLANLSLRRQSMSRPGRMEASTRDHVRLLEAIRSRDTSLARALTMSITHDAYIALAKATHAPEREWPFR
ncbi:GntR family transcriptional regulator [Corynebacterium guangdongense]|uniref:DNA-binding GntR family transcriptional regulator n=1 Tax=Corynebacterium guangdongense TaxID=1783348 RepID=A0ABU1ZVJ0_9CORY|nr:GntR family transcriptional regulator [Corynebacterium guangdongense]MDR7328378.1 DNA-binding GntR family transcriptional regulator [Corynebacterium guangdongense]WJZ16955.1 HTH-type transcriptional regulator McbR [Corynebacterium guangdongense]